MKAKDRCDIPEKEVIKAWLKRLSQNCDMVDTQGESIRVVYPGRPNDHRGADFRDAVISTGGDFHQGSIEVHSRVSGWQAHGHHQDPIYNQVVLHVAMVEDRTGGIFLQNGKTIPTVIIKQPQPSEGLNNLNRRTRPCLGIASRKGLEEVKFWLQLAGELRFQTKAARFKSQSRGKEEGEKLYQGILEALGYTKNKEAFRVLANGLSLVDLEVILASTTSIQEGLVQLQSRLLGKAGLLVSPYSRQFLSEEYLNRLRGIWRNLNTRAVMSDRSWELFKVRPGNHPVIRILAFSYLLSRHRQKSLLYALLNHIRSIPLKSNRNTLEAFFLVNLTDQGNHYRLRKVINSCGNLVLLGKERAAEIMVNVALPFINAWSKQNFDQPLARKANWLYHRYPRLEPNSIEKHMSGQFGLGPLELDLACQQQGLIHIYKSLCTQGKCEECFLVK